MGRLYACGTDQVKVTCVSVRPEAERLVGLSGVEAGISNSRAVDHSL